MPTILQIPEAPGQAINFVIKIKEMALEYAPKLIGAILVYIIGSWVINKIFFGNA